MYLRRRAEYGFVKEYPSNQSYAATHWLSFVEDNDGIHIQHARNGAEKQIGEKKLFVDGFCKYVIVSDKILGLKKDTKHSYHAFIQLLLFDIFTKLIDSLYLKIISNDSLKLHDEPWFKS
jgi:hypothetical protein